MIPMRLVCIPLKCVEKQACSGYEVNKMYLGVHLIEHQSTFALRIFEEGKRDVPVREGTW